MKKSVTALILLVFISAGIADESIKSKFKNQLDQKLSSHTKGVALVEGTVTSVKKTKYCRFRTSLCGMNAKCKHPKKDVTVIQITPVAALVNKQNISIPKSLRPVIIYDKSSYKTGEKVYFLIYQYKNGMTSVPTSMTKKSK